MRYGKFFMRISIISFTLLSLLVTLLLWYGDDELEETKHVNWINVKLLENQNEYIDKKGVHVVVGHYVGDGNSNTYSANLTDEIINSNMFEPKPNEGKNGQAVIIPSFLSDRSKQLFTINRFNLLASDRIPLDRVLPDVRRSVCRNNTYLINEVNTVSVIIVYHNEAWSTLLRTITSVINRSPAKLVKEILLVDDASTRKFLQEALSEYISHLSVPTYIYHLSNRVGLVKARLEGAKRAKGQILVFLDAHCECTKGWLEALVVRIAEDRTRVVCPVIDIIHDETFAYVRSLERHWGAFNWDLHFRWYATGLPKTKNSRNRNTSIAQSYPFKTPVMAGGLFAIDRGYFFEIGGYDEEMKIWGGENLELSFRVWQCGGSIEIVPCSHVGHVFRKSSPYQFPGGVGHILYSNLVRVALVWMDEWKDFYFKFHAEAAAVKNQDVKNRIELRERLNCHSFKWFLDNVWPQHFMPTDDRFFGKIKNEFRGLCLKTPDKYSGQNQPSGAAYISDCGSDLDLMRMFVMAFKSSDERKVGVIATDESLCLEFLAEEYEDKIRKQVYIEPCSGMKSQQWLYNEQESYVMHVKSGLCLDVDFDEKKNVVVNTCDKRRTQKWIFESFPWK